MGRGWAGAHARPVAQDKVLHRRADPPRGIGREADVALRLEPAGSLKQPKGAFLDEVAHRQAIVAELGRQRDHQAGVGAEQLLTGVGVAVLAPRARQEVFTVEGPQGWGPRLTEAAGRG